MYGTKVIFAWGPVNFRTDLFDIPQNTSYLADTLTAIYRVVSRGGKDKSSIEFPLQDFTGFLNANLPRKSLRSKFTWEEREGRENAQEISISSDQLSKP